MKPQTAAILALFATMSLSGCLGPGSSNWALEATRIDDVHEHGKTGQGIRIAVIDTGFDPAHPTLKHLVDGSTKNGEAIAYRDFLNGDSGIELASDDDGHGSHVLSILAAKPASVGFLQEADFHGVAPGATYLIARVCNHDTCDVSVVDDAVNWARSQGADIITLSLGGPTGQDLFGPYINLDPVESAINTAINQGIVVIASAGNRHPNESDVEFPARIEGVIAVGATDSKDRLASFSNHGNADSNECTASLLIGSSGRCFPHQKPELLAPGVGIHGAWANGDIVSADGTSQAAPFVAGAVALLLEGHAPLQDRSDVYELKEILALTTSHAPNNLHDDGHGYGLLDAYAANQRYN